MFRGDGALSFDKDVDVFADSFFDFLGEFDYPFRDRFVFVSDDFDSCKINRNAPNGGAQITAGLDEFKLPFPMGVAVYAYSVGKVFPKKFAIVGIDFHIGSHMNVNHFVLCLVMGWPLAFPLRLLSGWV